MAKKEVLFDEYCKICIHYQLDECEFPCDECLGEPANEDSHKPLYFKEKSDV